MEEQSQSFKPFSLFWDTDHSFFSDIKVETFLREKKLLCNPIGSLIKTAQQNKLFSDPFILGGYESKIAFENKWITYNDQNEEAMNYFASIESQHQFLTFEDLWKKEFYVTEGMNYGCDYLAYKYDPNIVHSDFMVFCLPEENVSMKDLVKFQRISKSNNKTAVIAKFNHQTNMIEYCQIEYSEAKE